MMKLNALGRRSLIGVLIAGEQIDALSIQEEIEQCLIEGAVKIYPEKGITIASLPFIVPDPDSLIAPNEFEAIKV